LHASAREETEHLARHTKTKIGGPARKSGGKAKSEREPISTQSGSLCHAKIRAYHATKERACEKTNLGRDPATKNKTGDVLFRKTRTDGRTAARNKIQSGSKGICSKAEHRCALLAQKPDIEGGRKLRRTDDANERKMTVVPQKSTSKKNLQQRKSETWADPTGSHRGTEANKKSGQDQDYEHSMKKVSDLEEAQNKIIIDLWRSSPSLLHLIENKNKVLGTSILI
jgi:hypothetical protein